MVKRGVCHLVLWVSLLQGFMASAAETSTAPTVAPLATATVEVVASGQSTSFDGVVEAVRQTVLAAQVAGAVVALDVKVGDAVKAGQLSVSIDARAADQNAAAGDAQVMAARVSLDLATKDLERQKQLFQKNYISQGALERAESQFRATQAQVAAQLAQAGAARTQSGFFVVKAVEQTAAVLHELGRHLATVPEVTDYQAYAGTAAPINFNGLVRQYYLRTGGAVGDLQVNLTDKHQRSAQSHAIAMGVRPALQQIGRRFGANIKVVEVPPGPPVLAPIVAEVYGPEAEGRRQVAQAVRAMFSAQAGVVDADDSSIADAPRTLLLVDRRKAAMLGVSQQAIVHLIELKSKGAP